MFSQQERNEIHTNLTTFELDNTLSGMNDPVNIQEGRDNEESYVNVTFYWSDRNDNHKQEYGIEDLVNPMDP